MPYYSNCRKPKRSFSRSGAAYVVALVTMLVAMTLSYALLSGSMGQFLFESTRCQKQAAGNLAEAGIDYAYWQVLNMKQALPFSADITLSSGSFHVEAVDDSARQPGAVLITSTGSAEGSSRTAKRVIDNSINQ